MSINCLHSQLWSWCCDHAILDQLDKLEKYAKDWYEDDPAYEHIMESNPDEADEFCKKLCEETGVNY